MRFITNKIDLETQEQLIEYACQSRNTIGIDIETVSIENQLPLGIGIALTPEIGIYCFDTHDELIGRILSLTQTVVAFNASFDIPCLNNLGFTVPNYEDSMLLAYTNGILDRNLEDISLNFLHSPYTSVTSQWKKPSQGNIAIDHVKMAGFCLQHALNALQLWDRLPKTELYQNIDRPCIDLVIEMEQNGILIDQYMLTQVEQDTIVWANRLEQEIKDELGMSGLNLASNPQVASALQIKGILGTRKTKAGKDSVSDESLAPLNNPLTDKILKHRSLMKTLTTYIPAFRSVDYQGKIHTRYGYTSTGRWNSSAPNLQNLTRDEKFEGEES